MMKPFRFYTITNEERRSLQADQSRGLEIVQTALPVARRLATTGGIYAPIHPEDEACLQNMHLLIQAYDTPLLEDILAKLYKVAALRSSDVGILTGRIQELFLQREPERALAELGTLLSLPIDQATPEQRVVHIPDEWPGPRYTLGQIYIRPAIEEGKRTERLYLVGIEYHHQTNWPSDPIEQYWLLRLFDPEDGNTYEFSEAELTAYLRREKRADDSENEVEE